MRSLKLAVAVAMAALLAFPAAATADPPPDRPAKVKECSDGIDNDEDGAVDFGADADCGSQKDNSERPEEPGTDPGPTTGPLEEVLGTVTETVETVVDNIPPLPAPTLEELEAAIAEVLGQLPPAPTQEELEAAIADVLAELPPVPPAP